MSSSVVKPGYGPTLPELARRLPRALQFVAIAAAVTLLLVVVWWVLFGRGSDLTRVVVKEPVAFNLGYAAPFERQPVRAGELLRLEGGGQEFVVRPLRLPPYRGESNGFLPLYAAAQLGPKMERDRPGLVTRGAGRVSINKVQGYEVLYQAPGPNGKRYGRRIMLLPDTTGRDGVELTLEADASAAVVNPDAVARTGPLKTALRSFRFGTDHP